MPIVLAFFASLSVHVGILLTDGWSFPSPGSAEEIDVLLLPGVVPEPARVPEPAKASARAERVAKKPPPPDDPVGSRAQATAASEPDADKPAAGEPGAPIEPTEPTEPTEPVAPPGLIAPVAEPMPAVRLANKGRVRYDITRGEGGLLIGQAIYLWEHDGLRYTASSQTETIGLAALIAPAKVVHESAGEIDAAGLHPLQFRNEQKKRTDIAQVDRARLLVRNGERESALGDKAATLQDMLSMYFQLSLLLSTGTPVLGDFSLPIITGRKLDAYRFEVIGEELVERRFNRFAARHLRARNGEDLIDLWIVPKLPLPLRIRFVDRKGDVYDQWMDLNDESMAK